MRLLTCALLSLAAFLVVQSPQIVSGSPQATQAPIPMSQEWFLHYCEEDEVIGFVEGNFDGVECIQREEG